MKFTSISKRRRRVAIVGIALLILSGALVADRYLKSRRHPGVLAFMLQLVRNYPKSWGVDAPHVSIAVSDKNMERIVAVVEAARARGVILAEGND